MPKKEALRGYLLHMAVFADDPVALSSEDIHEAFTADYPDFADFDDAFSQALFWLRDEGLIRFHSLPSGTNGEATVVDLIASAAGERALRDASSNAPELKQKGGLHLALAGMLGRFIGEWQNTQT